MTTTLPARAATPRAAPAEPAISVAGLRKTFALPHERHTTVKQRVLHPFRSGGSTRLDALDGVSLEVAQGEFLGVVGRNGSGKSTLLRCLSGIYPADAGSVAVRGRVAPFIDLGVGFNPELDARDNAIINAVLLGLTPRQARERIDAIVEFAELQDFVDVKLKNYSSGMVVRLAFAVTVQVDADVLLFDEVLAVGDADFQEKCIDRFQRLRDDGRTILIVTHDMGAVERFCDRAILLEKGRVAADGPPADVTRRYAELNAARGAGPDAAPVAQGTGIARAWFEDAAGRATEAVAQGESCTAAVTVTFAEAAADPLVEIELRDAAHRTVFATASEWAHGPTGRFAAGESAEVRVRFDNRLTPGGYTLTAAVRRAGGGLIDARSEAARLTVHGPRRTGGIVDLPHDFEVERR